MSGRFGVEFLFDIGSAYSYLAATQLAGFSHRTGAAFQLRPILLGAVFKATGNDMPARIPAKAKWLNQDVTRWARYYEVPYRLPSRFPLNTLRTQRALAAVEDSDPSRLSPFMLALFRAAWGDDRDVSQDQVIAEVASSVGLDGGAVVSAIDLPATKDRLRATTDGAVARGAFGAPTMFFGDQMFWGNDQFVLLERELALTKAHLQL